MTLRVLAVGSDSVGHLSHAAVLLDALGRRHDVDAYVAVPHDGRFREWIAARGFQVRGVGRVMGVHREFSGRDLLRYAGHIVFGTMRGMREAWALLDELRPDVVIGCGGRSSFAMMLTAALRGYPTLTVPHYAPRRTNRLLAWLVDRTCLARTADVAAFSRALRGRLRVTHTPLRPEAFAPAERRDACARLGLDPDRPVVACVGYSAGSPGTTRLFADVVRSIRAARPDAQLLVQHGRHQPADGDADALASPVIARPFFDDLVSLFPACDLAVSAAGETTLLELCARGVPSLTVSVADSPIGPHIRTLAEDVERIGGTIFFAREKAEGRAVAAEALRLLADDGARGRMGEAARAAADPRATEKVLDVIEELLRARGTLPRVEPTAAREPAVHPFTPSPVPPLTP
ncbi:MAG TPA: UDP-N-acetylglucosamine--N-acetylmuramyl-(pentapeptide) pyrophosphoryl-undecaprenol N-acetylglucosamine transferase [Longimicrobium sp.]|nr:UDP-N-acetylglucosamine--N-acetylmuramyl-(pentapeptide) pyrophosphoryl-undecaprenol N-acetylglucosamine transferase [Longimicrobium sp.]